MILTEKLVFLHMGKTGGTFVTKALERMYHPWLVALLRRYNLFFLGNLRYYKLYRSPIRICRNGEVRVLRSQHDFMEGIPPAFRGKPVLSCVRNPYDRYVSLYRFGWWKKEPSRSVREIKKKHPNYPDFTFREFLDFFRDEIEFEKRKLGYRTRYGIYTYKFVQMYYPEYRDILMRKEFRLEMPDVRFLEQENLSEELRAALLELGYPEKRTAHIPEMEKINKSRDSRDFRDYYDEETAERIYEYEKPIFELFGYEKL